MPEEKREQIYISCYFCNRTVEVYADAKVRSKITRIWGVCPICGAEYDIRRKSESTDQKA